MASVENLIARPHRGILGAVDYLKAHLGQVDETSQKVRAFVLRWLIGETCASISSQNTTTWHLYFSTYSKLKGFSNDDSNIPLIREYNPSLYPWKEEHVPVATTFLDFCNPYLARTGNIDHIIAITSKRLFCLLEQQKLENPDAITALLFSLHQLENSKAGTGRSVLFAISVLFAEIEKQQKRRLDRLKLDKHKAFLDSLPEFQDVKEVMAYQLLQQKPENKGNYLVYKIKGVIYVTFIEPFDLGVQRASKRFILTKENRYEVHPDWREQCEIVCEIPLQSIDILDFRGFIPKSSGDLPWRKKQSDCPIAHYMQYNPRAFIDQVRISG